MSIRGHRTVAESINRIGLTDYPVETKQIIYCHSFVSLFKRVSYKKLLPYGRSRLHRSVSEFHFATEVTSVANDCRLHAIKSAAHAQRTVNSLMNSIWQIVQANLLGWLTIQSMDSRLSYSEKSQTKKHEIRRVECMKSFGMIANDSK